MAQAKKGAKPRMEKKKRPMVLLPEDMHHQLRMYAAEHETTVKQVVTDAISQFLEKRKGGRK